MAAPAPVSIQDDADQLDDAVRVHAARLLRNYDRLKNRHEQPIDQNLHPKVAPIIEAYKHLTPKKYNRVAAGIRSLSHLWAVPETDLYQIFPTTSTTFLSRLQKVAATTSLEDALPKLLESRDARRHNTEKSRLPRGRAWVPSDVEILERKPEQEQAPAEKRPLPDDADSQPVAKSPRRTRHQRAHSTPASMGPKALEARLSPLDFKFKLRSRAQQQPPEPKPDDLSTSEDDDMGLHDDTQGGDGDTASEDGDHDQQNMDLGGDTQAGDWDTASEDSGASSGSDSPEVEHGRHVNALSSSRPVDESPLTDNNDSLLFSFSTASATSEEPVYFGHTFGPRAEHEERIKKARAASNRQFLASIRRDIGKQAAKASGEQAAKASGEQAAKASGEQAAKASGEQAAKASGEQAAKASGEQSAEAQGSKSGEEAGSEVKLDETGLKRAAGDEQASTKTLVDNCEMLDNVAGPEAKHEESGPKRADADKPKDSFQSLIAGEMVDDVVMHQALSVICAAPGWQCIDPLLTTPPWVGTNITISGSTMLALNLDLASYSHWCLIVLDSSRKEADMFDSASSFAHFNAAKTRLGQLFRRRVPKEDWDEWRLVERSAVQQRGSVDCGVYVLVFALYLRAHMPIPSAVDAAFWRHALYSLLSESPSPLPDEMIDLCSPGPRPSQGRISVKDAMTQQRNYWKQVAQKLAAQREASIARRAVITTNARDCSRAMNTLASDISALQRTVAEEQASLDVQIEECDQVGASLRAFSKRHAAIEDALAAEVASIKSQVLRLQQDRRRYGGFVSGARRACQFASDISEPKDARPTTDGALAAAEDIVERLDFLLEQV